jgi:hypothetical protein
LIWWLDYVSKKAMNTSPEPFGLPDTAPELARRFAVIMAGLGALIARRFLNIPRLSSFTVRLWSYLNRAVRRFHRALTVPAKAREQRARGDRSDIARTGPKSLPSGHGWIVRELGWEAAAYLGAMETLLAEIETRAAIAGAPGAGRVLRPICRMLGVSAALTPTLVVPALAQAGIDLVGEALQTPYPAPLPTEEGEERTQGPKRILESV